MMLSGETVSETRSAECLTHSFHFPISSIIYNNHLLSKSKTEFISV